MINTIFLRFMAMLLVVNSHLEGFYPIRQLAGDGLLGNSLFFMASGIGLALSGKKAQKGFLSWYWRRITKIYPSLILVVFVFYVLAKQNWQNLSPHRIFQLFVWPTPFGFISQIVIYYIAFFILMKTKKSSVFLISIVVLFFPYFYAYFTSIQKVDTRLSELLYPQNLTNWIFYFQIMLLGGYLALEGINKIHSRGVKDWIALFISSTAYILIKAVMTVSSLNKYYFLLHILVFFIAYFFLKVFQSDFITEKIMHSKVLSRIINLVAATTLEIYIVHESILGIGKRYFELLPFPANIFVFAGISILLAYSVHKLIGSLHEKVTRIASNMTFVGKN